MAALPYNPYAANGDSRFEGKSCGSPNAVANSKLNEQVTTGLCSALCRGSKHERRLCQGALAVQQVSLLWMFEKRQKG